MLNEKLVVGCLFDGSDDFSLGGFVSGIPHSPACFS